MALRSFSDIEAMANKRTGGKAKLNKELVKPLSKAKLKEVSDDRWLAEFTRSIFQAGFSWKVVDQKWPDFESVLAGFNLKYCAFMSDDTLDDLLSDKRVIRNGMKLKTIRHNAALLMDIADEYGSVSVYFSGWDSREFFVNLASLTRSGQRLGGKTAQVALRRLGVDSLILTNDVVSALIREQVVDKTPTSKGALRRTQDAVNTWMEESGRSLNEISKILALTVD